MDPITAPRRSAVAQALTLRLHTLPFPVIAALNGDAMGWGFELALAADAHIGERGDHPYGLVEVRLGIVPGARGLTRMARLAGSGRALLHGLSARPVHPGEAYEQGLIEELADDAVATAMAHAQRIATMPRTAVAMAKRIVRRGSELPLRAALEQEAECAFRAKLVPTRHLLLQRTYESHRLPEGVGWKPNHTSPERIFRHPKHIIEECAMTEPQSFQDRVVVISGAGRGLGREHALAFARRGANVVVNDLGVTSDGDGNDVSVAQTVVDEIAALGGKAVADTHSVADPEAAAAVIDTAVREFGRVDVLVNNAGIISYATFEDMTDEKWDRMLSVTLYGTYHMSKAVWPIFKRQGGGRIVNTTSNAGFAGSPQLSHYGSAKLAVAALTKNLALEGADDGIVVNAIAPMAITRMNQEAFFGGIEVEQDSWQDDLRSGRVPMGPASIVSPTVLWLSHPDTAVTGQVFSTSSGKVARVAFVVGEGYFNPDHTMEDLQQHADRIMDLGAFLDPRDTGAELAVIPPLFQKS
ncbi:SDR family NAD(P)-dependent oxidoreductase [Saccharopolyspora sp. ASAGF58]|uniref:SDR family NAD(P)-dependent oxidoreductase n=1 Tax=Saccharopolyspora sp. ASAGF58 TaxID=2719023 RepID=UPI00143FD453|nr:SDR family NAD(P)-dependent oxidoreductase [Saccharopolyspora sp. ASAGF58]QIZ37756.1 SDR family NAD(P)-dependent oxidoreductase [Saccharopolyspora sp. ASAGF58]